jgi:hypothetical protein
MPGRWRLWPFLVPIVVVLTSLPVGSASAASPETPRGGTVYVLNALAGTTARIIVDGRVVRESAVPKSVAGPVALAAGRHVVELWSRDSSVVAAQFTVACGDSLDVVAHEAADPASAPRVTVFRNDLASVGPGKARLVISHVAAAGPADVLIDGRPYFRHVANAESLSVVVPDGSYTLSMVATNDRRGEVLASTPLSVAAGTLARLFAFGDPGEGTADIIVQVLPVPIVGSMPPTLVRTGDGGQAAAMAVPVAPAGPAVPERISEGVSAGSPFPPTELVLPGGAVAPVLDSGVRPDGSLAVPDDPATVGWWNGGALAGDAFGSVVIAGHVDSARFGVGVMARLRLLDRGEVVELRAPGRRLLYRVTAARSLPQSELAVRGDAFRQDLPPRLVLITCGGTFDRRHHRYEDNLVVTAEPVGTVPALRGDCAGSYCAGDVPRPSS